MINVFPQHIINLYKIKKRNNGTTEHQEEATGLLLGSNTSPQGLWDEAHLKYIQVYLKCGKNVYSKISIE